MKPTVLSLFAGIGGIELGLESAGFEVVQQVEIDPYCRRVLARHFPHAERFEDVCSFSEEQAVSVDLIAAGWPCQDISNAGKRTGLSGERSGLWREALRTIRMVRPIAVLLENVAALLERGMGTVLGDLAASGYDAEWDCLSADQFGLDHIRNRVFIVGTRSDLSNADGQRCIQLDAPAQSAQPEVFGWPALPHRIRRTPTEPPVRGRADGIPHRVDRLRGLGNAVVPDIPAAIGRRLMSQIFNTRAQGSSEPTSEERNG